MTCGYFHQKQRWLSSFAFLQVIKTSECVSKRKKGTTQDIYRGKIYLKKGFINIDMLGSLNFLPR